MDAHQIRLAALTLMVNRGHATDDANLPALKARVDALANVITDDNKFPPDEPAQPGAVIVLSGQSAADAQASATGGTTPGGKPGLFNRKK